MVISDIRKQVSFPKVLTYLDEIGVRSLYEIVQMEFHFTPVILLQVSPYLNIKSTFIIISED